MVNALDFTFDGINSLSAYGLVIADFDDEHVTETEAFSPALSTLKVPSQLRFFHAGVQYDTLPTFEFSVLNINKEIIDPATRSHILSWLVGRNSFKPLKFGQDDLANYTYYCVFTNASIIYVNGNCYGFRLTATFDSQFARCAPTFSHNNDSSIIYDYQNPYTGTGTIYIDNESDILDDYVYPKITFKGNVKIKNNSDPQGAARYFEFSNVGNSTTVTVNNETKIITGINLDKFTSKNWLRLIKGRNELSVLTNGGGRIVIECPSYMMIGY